MPPFLYLVCSVCVFVFVFVFVFFLSHLFLFLFTNMIRGISDPCQILDPALAFREIDADGGGIILFDEFSHWYDLYTFALRATQYQLPVVTAVRAGRSKTS